MQQRTKLFVSVFILGILPAVFAYQEEASIRQLQSIAPILWQPSMNVFRRFPVEPSAMFEFYGKVVGLKRLSTFDLGRNISNDVASLQSIVGSMNQFRDEYIKSAETLTIDCRLQTVFMPICAASL